MPLAKAVSISSVSGSSDSGPQTHQAAIPADILGGYHDPHHYGAMADQKQPIAITRSSSGRSSSSSLRSPRTARFAEATTVISPVDYPDPEKSPFADPPQAQHHVSDVGFGYVSEQYPTQFANAPLTPASPLKSALKTPGTGKLNPLSPTFREELVLEKQEKKTEKENARDLKIKTRVRFAKVMLRCVNFSCSLIVLSLISTSVTIFKATKDLPPRSNLPPWAIGTGIWPQILLLSLSCVSLFTCLIVFWGYCRGGHRRAEKVGVYYSIFAVGFFTFSAIMWIVGAAVFQNAKASGNGQDLWGWSCNTNNVRTQVFQQQVNYSLVCRLQDWSLVCAIIEVVIELIVIVMYAVVFYRFYSKQRLKKTMDLRDKARSDLYLAQLRVQSAPNTPGFFAPQTPKSPYYTNVTASHSDAYSAAENGENYSTQYAIPKSPTRAVTKPFQLQPPPIKIHGATPKLNQEGFGNRAAIASPPVPAPTPGHSSTENQHVGAAPGERTYDAVPIPGAYASPLTSPHFPPPR